MHLVYAARNNRSTFILKAILNTLRPCNVPGVQVRLFPPSFLKEHSVFGLTVAIRFAFYFSHICFSCRSYIQQNPTTLHHEIAIYNTLTSKVYLQEGTPALLRKPRTRGIESSHISCFPILLFCFAPLDFD